MPTPRFIRSAAPSLTNRYSGTEATFRREEALGLHHYGYDLKQRAANELLTVRAPVASVNIGTPLASGGSVITFTAPKSYGSLYRGGASMGTGAEYLRARNAQTQNYLSALSR